MVSMVHILFDDTASGLSSVDPPEKFGASFLIHGGEQHAVIQDIIYQQMCHDLIEPVIGLFGSTAIN